MSEKDFAFFKSQACGNFDNVCKETINNKLKECTLEQLQEIYLEVVKHNKNFEIKNEWRLKYGRV